MEKMPVTKLQQVAGIDLMTRTTPLEVTVNGRPAAVILPVSVWQQIAAVLREVTDDLNMMTADGVVEYYDFAALNAALAVVGEGE